MVDLVGDQLDLFCRNQAAIGVNVMGTLSSEERDERLKHHLLVSKELHPALISAESTSTAHGWNLSCCAKTQRSTKPLSSMYCQRTINFSSGTTSSEFCKPWVAELSEPTSLEVKETIHSVVHGLLATLSPRMHSKAPDLSDNASAGTVNVGAEDSIDLVENTSINFQPQISLTRDYLARLLFWCMLLGHYLRGLEYRVELTELLSLPCGLESKGLSN